jgi:hypothetical protein
MTLLVMPVAHTVTGLIEHVPRYGFWVSAHLALGVGGFAAIWFGLRRPEIQACVLGYLGGSMMFVGFFELGFALFADVFNVQPIYHAGTGQLLMPPALQINEASILMLIPLFLLIYANRQVRCNMIVWLRKTLRMDPGRPTEPARDRPYARIVATETLFIIWMIYAISLVTLDPRVLGPEHPVTMAVYVGFFVWPLYLLHRIRQISVPGTAIRYAIPTGIIFWSWFETAASMKVFEEFYLHPYEYPVSCSLVGGLCALSIWFVYRRTETKPIQAEAVA